MKPAPLLLLLLTWPLSAQRVVFLGEPAAKVELSAGEADATKLTPLQAKEYQCIIARRGDQFFWVSRDNREMTRVAQGAYIWYVTVDFSGYVKVVDRNSPLGKIAREEYDYAEHLPMMLGSVNYWGKAAIHRTD